jgi:hypothetical protein
MNWIKLLIRKLKFRKIYRRIDNNPLLREAMVRNAEYISPDVNIQKWIDGKEN